MLWTPSSPSHFSVDNWGTNPSTTPGTSVVPGASDVEGSWTQVLSALAQAVDFLTVRVSNGGLASNTKRHVLDIGIDPAGGSSYTAIISGIVCGASATLAAQGAPGHQFLFPFRIPAGASVAVRIQGSNATAGTVIVGVRAYGQLGAPWLVPVGQYAETLGVSGSNGTAFTPGNAADGSWVSLGTLARHCWWFQLGYQINGATITAETTYIELARGDGSNKHLIVRLMHTGNTSEGIGSPLNENLLWAAGYFPTPAGTELWVRGRCNNSPDSGYQAGVIAIGG